MKTKLFLCVLDEFGNPLAKEPVNVNWELNIEQDKKALLENNYMKDEIEKIICEQIKVDLGKGAVSRLIDKLIQ